MPTPPVTPPTFKVELVPIVKLPPATFLFIICPAGIIKLEPPLIAKSPTT